MNIKSVLIGFVALTVVGGLWYGISASKAKESALMMKAEEEKVLVEREQSTDERLTEQKASEKSMSTTSVALFANGCFWCVEHDLEEVEGVTDVVSGYAGGTTNNPTYKNYIASGHREVGQVTYNPHIVSYGNLVEHIIKHGDPTDAEGSFYDRGFQYAPAIYYKTEQEKSEALAVIAQVDAKKVFENPLPLMVIPSVPFYSAEEYHQDYAKKNTIKYTYYRTGSGRTTFIKKQWGDQLDIFTFSEKPQIPKTTNTTTITNTTEIMQTFSKDSWIGFVKPTENELRNLLTPLQYEVTQEEGTESPYTNEYDKKYEEGIYVDIVSGEPLYFSKDKFDSGTGWPSFVKPISPEVVTLVIDKGLFSTRTEVRSKYADSHLGHVFDDGPADRGGKRYCMNSASLRFIAKAQMEKEGYGYLLSSL